MGRGGALFVTQGERASAPNSELGRWLLAALAACLAPPLTLARAAALLVGRAPPAAHGLAAGDAPDGAACVA